MVRVRKKCIGLAAQKTDALRPRGDLSSAASQTRKEPKRAKDFQGKLSHSSPPVTRSCSLTHIADEKSQPFTKLCTGTSNVGVPVSCPLVITKEKLEPNPSNDVEIIAVITRHNNKSKPICNHFPCSTVQSNPKCVNQKTAFLKPAFDGIVEESDEHVGLCSLDEKFKLETQSKSESNLEVSVPNSKQEQAFEMINLVEEENETLMLLPDGLDKVAIEVEVETSIDTCASTLPTDGIHDKLICQTPHKIRICNEDYLIQSPSSALSSLNYLSISTTPKKAIKSSRKLHPSQMSNQQVTITSSRPKQSEIIKQVIATNHKIDEYYPIVRRSNRKTKRTIFEEKQLEIEQAIKEEREDGLEVHNFEGKGRGVVTTRPFSRGEFVVEYSGELIDLGEAKLRETLYTQDQNTGCYMYYFRYRNRQYCIDATSESGRLGRLVNHSRANGNLITKTVLVENQPHLVLLAKDDIPAGEEIMYDYGDRSKESLRHHPWLKC